MFKTTLPSRGKHGYQVFTPKQHLAEAQEYFNAALQLDALGDKRLAELYFANAVYHSQEAYALC